MATSSQPALDQVRAAMAETNSIFVTEVILKRNIAALDQVYTENARILPPDAPMISGRPAIQNFWAGMIQAANPRSCKLTSVDVLPAGDSLVEIGLAKLELEPSEGGPAELEAKYVVYWRQEEGRWKWHVDIWNHNA